LRRAAEAIMNPAATATIRVMKPTEAGLEMFHRT
jgi:hypothetical protein